MKGIKCSKIVNGELQYIEGYSWKTDKETEKEFNSLKKFDLGYTEGGICLDLLGNDFNDILDTITISPTLFNLLRGRT